MRFEITKTTPVMAAEKHWRFCVGSCHAALAHRVDYIRQLRFIHEELGIERVRFHGIFNNDMKVVSDLGQLVSLPGARKFRDTSFRQIGVIYDNILSTGMKPFVELSFMPDLMASGKKKALFGYHCNITPPKSYAQWGEFIKSFVRFLIRRYGAEEVGTWFFEVWNEPNLGSFWSANQDAYFRLYAAAARGIKEVDPHIPVGGPSTAVSAWTPEFIAHCEKNGVPLDFLSTHQYAGEALGHSIKKRDILKHLAKQAAGMKRSPGGGVLEGVRLLLGDGYRPGLTRGVFYDNARAVRESAGNYPLYYTEWNVSATCGAEQNDTSMAAAYAVKSVLDLEGLVQGSSFWTFSDIFEELFFFPNPFSGSFGLLSIDGIPKPSFYAFQLLSQTGNERFRLPRTNGDIEMGAYKSPGEIQLLLYRQSHEKGRGTAETVEVSVELDRPPAAVTAQRIDEAQGNPYKTWQDLGAPMDLLPGEVEEITRRSRLREEVQAARYAGGKLLMDLSIARNDVVFVKIKTGSPHP
jgi:xylan 1,4-beta-xylosidase